MTTINYIYILTLLTFLFSCNKKNPTHLYIEFIHTVDDVNIISDIESNHEEYLLNNKRFKMNNDLLPYTNFIGQKYNIQTLKYLISNIKIVDINSMSTEIKDIHFVDISDPNSLIIDCGEIENREYDKILFTMGIDSIYNISNEFINENFHSTMYWPEIMGGGYHYMKLEGDYDTITKGYATHTGGTNGKDFSFNNIIDINITTNDQTEAVTLTINMNINNWYQNPNTINISPGIMSNESRQLEIKQNGENNVFTLESINILD